jgi:hypothetical protein
VSLAVLEAPEARVLNDQVRIAAFHRATPPAEPIKIWGAGFAPNEVVSLIAVGAAEGNLIFGGVTANKPGASTVMRLTPARRRRIHTLRAAGSMVAIAVAPLIVVSPNWN